MNNEINMREFQYTLPEERIAKFPIKKRDESKLLIYKDGHIKEEIFKNIASALPQSSLLIFNNTKVIRARLIFLNEHGAQIEIFCLEPFENIPTEIAMQKTHQCAWICSVGNLKKWKEETLTISTNNITLKANKSTHAAQDGFVIILSWDNEKTFAEILESLGKIPLPPYLKRNEEEADKSTYQTVYAEVSGSVAAPTAGLHFTENVLNDLKQRGHQLANTTLHVGAGTFKPVKSDNLTEHHMHHEEIIVTKEFLIKIANYNGLLIAVGTTSLRTLESIYWLSHLIIDKELKPHGDFYYLSQWAAYGLQKDHGITFKQSCLRLLKFFEAHNINFIKAKTQIIISPGYRINSIDAIITNFHQPGSTLLVLISTLIGEHWKDVYNYALENNYRFLSYGDSSLLFNPHYSFKISNE